MKRLSAVCDGALTIDASGFSGTDAVIGHSLARQPRLTPKQAVIAAKLCRKYQRQLGQDFLNG